jgi:hypothetical protein
MRLRPLEIGSIPKSRFSNFFDTHFVFLPDCEANPKFLMSSLLFGHIFTARPATGGTQDAENAERL